MKILFAFENPLPNHEADAEVFTTTARYLAPLADQAWLHIPAQDDVCAGIAPGVTVIPAHVPLWPAALRHLCCGLTLVWRNEFRQADFVYTRNLWIAWMALLFGQAVVFDHYRPWPDQIPPLQFWIYRLFCNRRFLIGICHSNYTKQKYQELGIPADKLACVHNGFEPQRFAAAMPVAVAKQIIGIAENRKTVVYTGRINHKKGLGLVLAAARRLPDITFILVGSHGEGKIEKEARATANVRIVPFQAPDTLAHYIAAADALLIPPSLQPLTKFGSTVLPLKLFYYLASGRPILAGDTPDVREVLRHGENALLSRPDDVEALVAGLQTLVGDAALADRLAGTAQAESRNFTWEARAAKIALLIAARRRAAPGAHGGIWSWAHSGTWLRESRRWLTHLLRTRSFILPPRTLLPAPYKPLPSMNSTKMPRGPYG